MNYDLRNIKRLDDTVWTTVRMIDLKKDDIFQMFEQDNDQVGDTWIATDDSYPDPKHEGLSIVMAAPFILHSINDDVSGS